MELYMEEKRYKDLPNTAKAALDLLGRPFYLFRYFDKLYINEDLTALGGVVEAIEAMWRHDRIENDDQLACVDNAYSQIEQIAGREAAQQIQNEWREAAKRSRRVKAEQAAIAWADSVYKALGDDEWEEMSAAGYDWDLVCLGLPKAADSLGRESRKTLAEAAFVYGYQLARSYFAGAN